MSKGKVSEQRRSEISQGTLDLMILKTLDAMGPLHGYGIAPFGRLRLILAQTELLRAGYTAEFPDARHVRRASQAVFFRRHISSLA